MTSLINTPTFTAGIDVLIINKTDLLPYVRFNMEYFRQGVEMLNPGVATFPLSCTTGEGFDPWIDWLKVKAGDEIAAMKVR